MRLLPVLVVYILLFALLVNRMFQLQIVKGDEYEKESQQQATKTHARLKQHVEISMIVMESYWPIMHYRIT